MSTFVYQNLNCVPLCTYYMSPKGCALGQKCNYRHDKSQHLSAIDQMRAHTQSNEPSLINILQQDKTISHFVTKDVEDWEEIFQSKGGYIALPFELLSWNKKLYVFMLLKDLTIEMIEYHHLSKYLLTPSVRYLSQYKAAINYQTGTLFIFKQTSELKQGLIIPTTKLIIYNLHSFAIEHTYLIESLYHRHFFDYLIANNTDNQPQHQTTFKVIKHWIRKGIDHIDKITNKIPTEIHTLIYNYYSFYNKDCIHVIYQEMVTIDNSLYDEIRRKYHHGIININANSPKNVLTYIPVSSYTLPSDKLFHDDEGVLHAEQPRVWAVWKDYKYQHLLRIIRDEDLITLDLEKSVWNISPNYDDGFETLHNTSQNAFLSCKPETKWNRFSPFNANVRHYIAARTYFGEYDGGKYIEGHTDILLFDKKLMKFTACVCKGICPGKGWFGNVVYHEGYLYMHTQDGINVDTSFVRHYRLKF